MGPERRGRGGEGEGRRQARPLAPSDPAPSEILYNRDDEHELAKTLAASLEKARAVKMAR